MVTKGTNMSSDTTQAAPTIDVAALMARMEALENERKAERERLAALEAANAELREREAQRVAEEKLQQEREGKGWRLTSDGWIDSRGYRVEDSILTIPAGPGKDKRGSLALYPAKIEIGSKGTHSNTSKVEINSYAAATFLRLIESGRLQEALRPMADGHEQYLAEKDAFKKSAGGTRG